jgi:NhaA family Na+:H+ antiporter
LPASCPGPKVSAPPAGGEGAACATGLNLLQEFSVPLLAGVFVALLAANLDFEAYHHLIEWDWITPGKPDEEAFKVFGYRVSLHWFINDIFMVFFFGIAAKEIAEATLPGGSLNPVKKAINPLFATIGGVAGPVGVFFGGLALLTSTGLAPEGYEWGVLQKGWGVPTATDIALAWLVARTVFGRGHPAINFLLLLAVADDAIGLVIIAVFYGDPSQPAEPVWLLLVVLGMALAYGMRRADLRSWWPYILVAGPFSWVGLSMAHLHPALALVPIVPFLPGPRRDTGLFVEEDEVSAEAGGREATAHEEHSPLHNFEHDLKVYVDFGLFFFAFTNAGVEFAGIGSMTWLILASLVVGKTVGVGFFGWLAVRLGFPLPDRMGYRELLMAGFVAALGLTVALFVAGAAFPGEGLVGLQGQAKMGALFSGLVGIVAVVLGRMLRMKSDP